MYTVRIFMKCTHVCAAQKVNLLFTKLKIKPDFPSLADEIAEPHPDMNIKVAAFTVSEKSSITSQTLDDMARHCYLFFLYLTCPCNRRHLMPIYFNIIMCCTHYSQVNSPKRHVQHYPVQ